MQIVLWSDEKDCAGTTSLTAVLAALIAIKGNYKTLLTHPMIRDTSMESYLLNQQERAGYGAHGESQAEGLFRLLKNGRLDAASIKDYSYSLLSRSNLDFICTNRLFDDAEEHWNNYLYLLHKSQEFYDMTVTDLHVPVTHPLFYRSLENADVLLVAASQNQVALKRLMDTLTSEKEKLRAMDLHIQLVIHPFDRESSVTLKQMVKSYRIKSPHSIAYDIRLKDACNRSELLDYVLREGGHLKGRKNPFFEDMNQLSDKVLAWCQEVQYA